MISTSATRFVISVPTGDGDGKQHAWSDAAYPGQPVQEWTGHTLPGLLNIDNGTEVRIDLVDEAEEIVDAGEATFRRQPR
ncbi:hypothetical protein [Nocardia pseudovaccinii]|uniref:hypothetical protein n=1 Tax=Nocardia pseudovaccinii TaxID=189540 RepID=UPI0007A4A2DE|nr:hypothetical protein [Nocardia pseudovaccinii]